MKFIKRVGLQTSAPDPLPIPKLAGYDSPAMGGHDNPVEQCSALREKYEAQYPQFNIVMKTWGITIKTFGATLPIITIAGMRLLPRHVDSKASAGGGSRSPHLRCLKRDEFSLNRFGIPKSAGF